MERLTEYTKLGSLIQKGNTSTRQMIDKLGAYEDIGTIEELKAIKQWKSDIIESFSKYDVNSVDELMKRFRELTEKAEPKKAIGEKYIEAYCPTCKEVISDGEFWLLDEYVHHCNNCGQAVMYVDWE